MPDFIISSPSPTAGLSNRIKGLVSCLRICDKEGKKLLLDWSKSNAFNCDFDDLFENRFVFKSQVKPIFLNQSKLSNSAKLLNTWRLIESFNDLKIDQRGSASGTKPIDFQYNAIPHCTRKTFIPYFQQLKPKRYIRDEVANFSKKFDEDTISLAIRTWEGCESREHSFKLSNVFSILDNHAANQFFISCDSQNVLNQIRDKYADNIFYYPPRTIHGDRNSKEGIQDALIDLLLLSKNNKIKASRGSTFSEVAWWFGNCEAEVEII